MCLILLFLIFVSLLPTSLASSDSPSTQALIQQCWHEYPLTTALFQSSQNGEHDIVFQLNGLIQSTVHSTQDSRESSARSNYGPWTHQPACTKVLQSIGSNLCVYTNSSFSNGRGISIFTTPTLANQFAALPAFMDPAALDGVNTFSGAWYTETLPGKGVAMLAKKKLKFGDRVTAYTPALIAYLEDELDTIEREKYWRIAISQLPEDTRNGYLSLAYIYGQENIRVQDIVKANTFQLDIGGQNHLAVFPETSRLNHACSPNAQYHLDPSLLTHFVAVTRPISPNEEITISYTSPLEPTEIRQQHLQSGFHFSCTCPRCSAKRTTDKTIQQIQTLQKSLNDWSATSSGSPKLAEKLIQLYRKEGLEGFLDVPYGFAALAYNAVGDAKRAEKYAQQAREIILMKDGKWTPNMQLWSELLRDPRAHWSYGRRKR
ncbi:SET domain-containing protein [Lojkania enalia]|uniref:SET domain-containing protein n=1 Tax=Lojkania enalia TaxID=147567 RepID=A0A9P4K3N0_9PLEO|nr:SET domain-containing protein [Didymosphaeria enalia]